MITIGGYLVRVDNLIPSNKAIYQIQDITDNKEVQKYGWEENGERRHESFMTNTKYICMLII